VVPRSFITGSSLRRARAICVALLATSGCHTGLALQSYSVDWDKAPNDVRAWGDTAMAHASKTWHGKGTIEIEPTLLDDAPAARDAFLAEGYVRRAAHDLAFTPAGHRAGEACDSRPSRDGMTCLRFVLGRIRNVAITSYSYHSKNLENGMSRTLDFRFRITPTTSLGRRLEEGRALVCDEGMKTTPLVLDGETGTTSVPIDAAWTRDTWCDGELTAGGTSGDDRYGYAFPLGPHLPQYVR
jgi:hypothetical protein